MSNLDTILSFLRGKGLTPAQAAGVAGNLQVESNFNPEAYNPREQAIGIAQWEGGRRTRLQEFARANGGSETDLVTQLLFMWSEFTGSESRAYSRLQGATTASDAASVFDQYYERSSGAARGTRVQNANQLLDDAQAAVPKATAASASGGSVAEATGILLGIDGVVPGLGGNAIGDIVGGALKGDLFTTDWAGDAMKVALYLAGTLMAGGLVIAGVMYTVKK